MIQPTHELLCKLREAGGNKLADKITTICKGFVCPECGEADDLPYMGLLDDKLVAFCVLCNTYGNGR